MGARCLLGRIAVERDARARAAVVSSANMLNLGRAMAPTRPARAAATQGRLSAFLARPEGECTGIVRLPDRKDSRDVEARDNSTHTRAADNVKPRRTRRSCSRRSLVQAP